MLATVCDVCGRRIDDRGHQLDLVQTRVVQNVEGPPRMIDWGSIHSVFVCDACRGAVEHTLHARNTQQAEQ